MSKIEEDKECNNFDFSDDDEEQCIETKKKLQAENILFNMIDYKEDIMKYMRKIEKENRAKEDYMKKQMDITNSMRSILVDWLVEVAEEYKMNVETLYLACNFIDRFLSQMSVLRNKLQLVGTSCMYIAAKYEEIIPPGVNEFVYITDDTYTRKQVLRMEHLLLRIMNFNVSVPTANWFLTNFLKFIKLNTNFSTLSNSDLFQRIEFLARYLSELTLLDCETFLKYLPSQIAASAVYLSLYTFNKPWTKQIAELVGYSQDLSELKLCINDMFKMFQRASELPQKAIREKYKQAKYEHVSLVDPPKSLPAFMLIQSAQNSN
jgi:cyclin A